MNKSEIEIDIAARIGPILEISIQDTERPANYGTWYRAVCKSTAGGVTAYAQSIYYYVFDEGTGIEEAFYKDQIPEKHLGREDFNYTTAWRDTIQAFIDARETAGTIEKGIIRSVNEEKEFAVVEIYIKESNTLRNRLYLAYKDNAQATAFERIIQE